MVIVQLVSGFCAGQDASIEQQADRGCECCILCLTACDLRGLRHCEHGLEACSSEACLGMGPKLPVVQAPTGFKVSAQWIGTAAVMAGLVERPPVIRLLHPTPFDRASRHLSAYIQPLNDGLLQSGESHGASDKG